MTKNTAPQTRTSKGTERPFNITKQTRGYIENNIFWFHNFSGTTLQNSNTTRQQHQHQQQHNNITTQQQNQINKTMTAKIISNKIIMIQQQNKWPTIIITTQEHLHNINVNTTTTHVHNKHTYTTTQLHNYSTGININKQKRQLTK